MADGSIATERLILRPPAPDDLPWILESMNTSAVMRYLGGEVRTRAEIEESLAADCAAFWSGGHQRWTIWLRDDAVRVGRCGLFHVRSPAAPPALQGQREIGWTLAEPRWGHGYATEAARAVLDLAFGPMGLPVVYSQTSDSNVASTRMMARLGFTRWAELGYVDPDYPPRDNPTTVWSLAASGEVTGG
jgi:RimJ/RimL family protein N-acetyltransferase